VRQMACGGSASGIRPTVLLTVASGGREAGTRVMPTRQGLPYSSLPGRRQCTLGILIWLSS